ncbi:probable crossover junction endonuclease EME2 isoform X2 [Cephus cinctus]|uniref:Probable crossover junction endonuclease EME2 isoform X2 n=1 Tax=Cephus cinctus TaxID=211228 RepID=A0AAJ7RHR8_CEPCN|nr:probable crossover junction endonuclease EME2 isoform X2 [Cephus cinctus]
MSEVIVLSDSDDSVSTIGKEELLQQNDVSSVSPESHLWDDNEFPEVLFDYVSDKNDKTNKQKEYSSDSAFQSSGSSNLASERSYKLLENSSDIRLSTCTSDSNYNLEDVLVKKYLRLPTSLISESRTASSSSYESQGRSIDTNEKYCTARKPLKTSNDGRERLRAEKLQRLEDAAKIKAQKVVTVRNMKNIQSGECMKFMKVIIDESLANFEFYAEIIVTLEHADLAHDTKSQLLPQSIRWMRNVEKYYVDKSNTVSMKMNTQDEDHVIVIWNWDDTVNKIACNTFCAAVVNIKELLCQKKVTLVVFGIEEYFKYHKNLKRAAVKGAVVSNNSHRKNKSTKKFGDFPKISRRDLETCLTEIQITANINSRLIETSQDLSLMIYQYTKAIAEIPYKLEKRQALEEKVDWYVAGDNRDTVKVDKDGNGLKRLWQQQLCQFNLSSLETADAICSVYSSPMQLLEVRCLYELHARGR